MARVVKEEEYAGKRNEILDVTQRLVYTKGYEQMSIQDILSELHISKGAFYHYFESKPALLEGLIERMIHDVTELTDPILQDPNLPAIDKLRRYFDMAGRWKTERKDYLLNLTRVWYQDDNAIVRQKTYTALLKQIGPLLTDVIRQGVAEGVFTTDYPEIASEILWAMFQGMGDTLSSLVLSLQPGQDDPERLIRTVAAYSDALERILGAAAGSLILADVETLLKWTDRPRDATPATVFAAGPTLTENGRGANGNQPSSQPVVI